MKLPGRRACTRDAIDRAMKKILEDLKNISTYLVLIGVYQIVATAYEDISGNT